MSLEQQLTETSQAVLMLTKSVDLLTALLGDVIASNDSLTAALKSINLPTGGKLEVTVDKAAIKEAAEKAKKEADNAAAKASAVQQAAEASPAPFEKEDFAKRMGEIVELVNALKGDGRAIAQGVLALTGSDKIGMTLAMPAEKQAEAINNLDDAIKVLKSDDKTIAINQQVMGLLVDLFKPKQEAKAETQSAPAEDDFPADEGDKPNTDYYDNNTKIELTQVQLAMRAHAATFGKDSAIAIIKAGGSPTGAAKDLPELRRKSVIDKLMQGA
ncbi:hypothetical protein [Achromobacter phage SE2]|nr:hypothetical protein [Achromobacter phage SE2]